MSSVPQIELTAPAGSFASLHSAIKAGADSVYFGLDKLNMRARAAKPFTRENLPEIVSACNQVGIKSYLALNTILYNEDLEQMRTICLDAREQGVAAVIASDIAAITYAAELGLEVHISTQANISNFEAVRFFSQWADVMVLARELSLKQIKEISTRITHEKIRGPSGNPVRLEVFVHGAICVAISGKCYMSLSQSGHSANRGDCLQPCRRQYKVTEVETGEELIVDNEFVMSPKDLCTISILDRLADSGVSIFKIEGRGRSPDYVGRVTEAYRQALDSLFKGNYTQAKVKKWTKTLESVFNRGFWEGGYYLGQKTGEWSGAYGSVATHQKFFSGIVTNYFNRLGVAEVEIKNDGFKQGDHLMIIGPTTGTCELKMKNCFVNDKPVKEVQKGMIATIQVPDKVRRNDKVYIFRERENWQS
ncbi:U32 family peptidase [candidate division KSB1 bacterium]|nr:U32 family peptidase [candidate division KSB1 bacterium]